MIHTEAWYRESLDRGFEEALETFRRSWDLPSLLRFIRVTRRSCRFGSENFKKMEQYLRDYTGSVLRYLYPGHPLLHFRDLERSPVIVFWLPALSVGDDGAVTLVSSPKDTEERGEVTVFPIFVRGRGTLGIEKYKPYTIPELLEALGIYKKERQLKEATRPIRLDPEMVDLAVDAAMRAMTEEVKSTRGWLPNTAFGPSVLLLKDVRGEDTHVRIVWIPVEEGPRWGFFRGAFYGSYEGNPLIALKFNSLKTPEELVEILLTPKKRATLEDSIRSYLYHELTHSVDVYPEGFEYQEGEDTHTYANSPHEVRAFMQQVAQQALRRARELGEDSLGFFSTREKLMEDLLSYSESWNKVQKWWTPENRKLVLRGTWQFLEDSGVWDSWQRSRDEVWGDV